MSNPTDPTRPAPDQPDPKKPEQGEENREATGRSSFDFELPEGVNTYSDIPPVGASDADDTGAHQAALPPPPEATRPSSASFDFIELPEVEGASLSGTGLHNAAVPPAPPAPPPEEDAVTFDAPAPTADPASFTMGSGVLDLAALPDVPEAAPAPSNPSVPDISTLFPPPPPDVPIPEPDSFVMGTPATPDLELPLAEPASDVFSTPSAELPIAEPASDVFSVPSLPVVPTAEVSSDVFNTPSTPELPVAEAASDVFSTPSTPEVPAAEAVPVTAMPTPDLESVIGSSTPPVVPVAPSEDWLDLSSVVNQAAEAKPDEPKPEVPQAEEAERVPTGRSSFDFELPEGINTYSDIPPVAAPDADDTSTHQAALPPRPEASRPASNTFDFIDLPEADIASLSDSGLQKSKPPMPSTPLLTPTDGVIDLPPPAMPVSDPEAAVGHPEPADLANPVAPASGWLDSDVQPATPAAESPSDPLAPTPASPIDSSDIFSGARAPTALPVEQSDVIAATAYGPADAGTAPPEPVRLSDVALTFDGPPGGSTLEDSGSELPIADELPGGSSALLGAPTADSESIHDMPDPASDPLFDSSKLADTPDLPATPAAQHDDAPDYGRVPTPSADASSILADLSDPDVPPPSADSSSVRVESPGVDRTLTGGPAEGAFDLTVSDEPVPANLFDEPSDGTSSESTDWQAQSGSDLFADRHTAPEIDLDAERVEPVDADLTSDQPSLTSAPSSIFSGSTPPSDSGSTGSANVRIGTPEPPSDLAEAELAEAELAEAEEADDAAAEFSDHPALGDTAEREKDIPPAVPPRARPAHGLSEADFDLPPEATAPTPALPDEEGGAIDWDTAALSDDDNATRGIPKDASLSAIMRGLSDDSTESPTKDANPVSSAPTDDTGTPVVTVDWMAGSAEGSAMVEPLKTDPVREERARRRNDRSKPRKKQPDDSGAEAAVVEKTSPKRAAEKAKPTSGKKGGGMLVGFLLGSLLVGGAAAGAYFGDLLPKNDKTVGTPPPANNGGQQPNPTGPQTPPAAAAKDALAAGNLSKALELVKAKPAENAEQKATAGSVRVYANLGGVGTADDLKQGQADLQAAINEAPQTPEGEQLAVKATIDLGASYEASGNTDAAKKLFTQAKTKYTKYADIFDALLEKLNTPPVPSGTSFRLTPADIEKALVAATLLLAEDVRKTPEEPEPGIYYWKAVRLGAEGKYIEAIDLIGKAKAAHVKRAKLFASRGLNPLTDPLEQMFPRACDELAAYWKLRAELYSNPGIATAMKKDGVANTLNALAKAQADLATTEKDLTAAKLNITKLMKEAEDFDKKEKVYKADALLLNKKIEAITDDRDKIADQLKKSTATVTALADALKPALTLPEKWTDADLLAGAKNLAAFVKEKDLKTLIERVTKAEAAAKVATDKLTTETKKLTDKYEGDIKKLKDDYAADVKKLKDDYTADVKKLKEDHTDAVTKLKDANALDMKKLTDKYALDTKKLIDDHKAALAAEEAKTDAEKKKAALAALSFQKQLANAVSPSQALDIWLPVLTDLRRPSDADPAMAIAARALASSPADSDDAAKARTVNGMGLLLKGDLSGARDEFKAAKRSPAYKADKAWAKVADAGLEAVDDPLSPYRQPVVIPPVDRKAAARSLHAGIAAYKDGKYEAAVAALTDAAKNNPADPIAWYYLGATRFAMGNEEQAKKDIAQGAEREKFSPNPARVVSDALSPIQGEVRDAIDRARP